MNEDKKTFEKLGIIFTEGGCNTCIDKGCHNISKNTKNGIEYNVHIYANFEQNIYEITATQYAYNISDNDIIKSFDNEHDAVDFMCKNFEKFTCA